MEFTTKSAALIIAAFFAAYAALGLARDSGVAWRRQKNLTALFSVFMYGLWYPPGLLLVAFFIALVLAYGAVTLRLSEAGERVALVLAVACSLGVLFTFKYFNFFVDALSLKDVAHVDLILPVGISFYTFTVIGYVVDVHRREVAPVRGLAEATIVVTFWPHLAAGPILRARNMVTGLQQRTVLAREDWLLAVVLIFGGAAKKMLIADNLGAYVNENLTHPIAEMDGFEALATLLGFTGQIYADFSGYSEMAMGFALLAGFRLPANFSHPYRATSLTDFWRRWHISLSTWFRDYLFIPLGGSRASTARTSVNLMVVFLLSGLWHGAGFGFVIWGAIHGAVLVLEKVGRKGHQKVPAPLRWVITQGVVVVAWAFFRLPHAQAVELLTTIFKASAYGTYNHERVFYTLPIAAGVLLVAADHLVRTYRVDEQGFPRVATPWRSSVVVVLAYGTSLFLAGRPLPFIYFYF
jgi:alginate O-acetyltransferase complex protein AlgI